MTFGSLFAGIGGFDLGFERAGMRCIWQVENNEFCRKVLAYHWPNVPRWSDVKTFCKGYESWPHAQGGVDVICGGDPCQRNSAAGKSTQESLGGEFVRIIDALRPRIVVRENPSIVRKDAPWPWWRFRLEMERLGYAVLPFRLRACCLGAKHRRERLFLLCELPNPNSNRLERRARPSRIMETIQSPRLVEKMDWPAIPTARGFNSRAGIPNYVDEMRAIGNAVPPQVAEWIGRRIYDVASNNP